MSAIVFAMSLRAAPSLKTLRISRQNAAALDHVADYPDLEVLSITCLESLKALPDSIGKLARLKELTIDNGNGCSMNPQLPETFGNLQSLEKLTLYGAQDITLRGHKLAERHPFPSSMSNLKNLVYLDLGRNGFEEVPSFVKDLPKLRELRFAWNTRVKEIPPFLSNLQELTTLRLEGDDLSDLPDSLSKLPHLGFISLGNNCKITNDESKMESLRKRFPKVKFDFEQEYDCPAK